jgi:protein-L-isoaspartate(D-aspartate) O-methyltransferase
MTDKKLLLQSLIRDGYLKTPLLIEAFEKIDRRDFVLPEEAGEAYENYPLPIGFGQTISQPLTVAFMLELLCGSPDAKGRGPDQCVGKKILDIGAGSGWTTALLAYIVTGDKRQARRRGMVVGIERIPELCKFGEHNVEKYNFVSKGIAEFHCGDGSMGYKAGAPYDKILAGAAGEEIPAAWKEQLNVGGRIVAPVGQSIVVLDKISEKEFTKKEYFGFSFVPLVSDK